MAERISQKAEIRQGTTLYNALGIFAALGFAVGCVGAAAGGTYVGKKGLDWAGFEVKVGDFDLSDPVALVLSFLFVGMPAAVAAGHLMDRYYSGPTV